MPTDQILATEEMVGAGHGTKADTLNRALNKLTTAGDLMYATAAQTVARLAVTANGKLFGNAGGTAPEYATGLYVKTFTRDMTAGSGDVAYTTVGFKPAAAVFIFEHDTYGFGVGLDDGTRRSVVLVYNTSAPGATTNYCMHMLDSTGLKTQSAIVKTWDADGFTLTWTKANDPTGTLNCAAILFR